MIKEIKIALKSPWLLITSLIVTALCFTVPVYTDEKTLSNLMVIEILKNFTKEQISQDVGCIALTICQNSISGYLVLAMPFIAAIPCIPQFLEERNSGFIRMDIIREQKKSYFLRKAITSVLCAGIAVMIGFIIYSVIIQCIFPSADDLGMSLAEQKDYALYKPVIHYIKLYIGMFVFGAVSVALALLFSSFIRNKYIVLCCPFLLNYVMQMCVNKMVSSMMHAGNDNYQIFEMFYTYSCVNFLEGEKAAQYSALFYGGLLLFTIVLYVMISGKRRDIGA